MDLYTALTYYFETYGAIIPKNSKQINKEIYLRYLASNSYNPKQLGYSESGLSKFTKRVFPEKPLAIGVRNWLLSLYNLKYCNSCSQVKTLEEFNKSAAKADLLGNQCKKCAYQSTKNTSVLHSANRRARLLKATPKWADLTLIKDFYLNCPSNFEVDHIIPLQGKYVCGFSYS